MELLTNQLKELGIDFDVMRYHNDTLDLSSLGLEEIPMEGITEIQPKKLLLNDNSLTSLPSLRPLHSLQSLNVSNNMLVSLQMNELNSLLTLQASYNDLYEISLPPNLYSLVLESNELSVLDLTHLQSLEYLNLISNHLTSIQLPAGVKEIYLSENLLAQLEITSQTLKRLIVSHNQLSSLELDTPQLEVLIVDSNNLKEINCTPLTHLIKLSSGYNKLQSLYVPATVTHLAIPSNPIQQIQIEAPENIKHITIDSILLESLDLNANCTVITEESS